MAQSIISEGSSIEKEQHQSRDLYQTVTDTIIAQLERGVVPWHKPWVGGDAIPFRLPLNISSNKAYQGINILLLWGTSLNRDYACHEWGTLKQWNKQEESIRKGEKGSMIVYYDTFEKEIDGEIKKIPFLKSSFVFNRCQLASYDPLAALGELPDLARRIDVAEAFVANTKAIIKHHGIRACYKRREDEIQMPPMSCFIDTEQSTATENYYSTLFHELTHWTGNEKRLDRKKGKTFGDNQYALEELIAELGAAFLSSKLEITNSPRSDHANYLQHWLDVLKVDKKAIIHAASQAAKAVEYTSQLAEYKISD